MVTLSKVLKVMTPRIDPNIPKTPLKSMNKGGTCHEPLDSPVSVGG